MTRRIEVLVPQDRVDGGVGELLPHEDGHLLEVAGRVVLSVHVGRPTIPAKDPLIKENKI